jgi:hypothetical protein
MHNAPRNGNGKLNMLLNKWKIGQKELFICFVGKLVPITFLRLLLIRPAPGPYNLLTHEFAISFSLLRVNNEQFKSC